MKKLILLVVAVAFLASAAPVFADVNVEADLIKIKRVLILEAILKLKTVFIRVNSTQELDGAAEAEAIANVVNAGNRVPGQLAGDSRTQVVESNDDDLSRLAVIANSVLNNSGIVMLNQDVGNMVNQGNVISIALTDAGETIVDSQAAVEQINVRNLSAHHEAPFPRSPASRIDKHSLISNAINQNSGIVAVNQNTGNMNNQTTALAIAVGLDDNDAATPGAVVALSEAWLGQVNADNHVVAIQTHYQSNIVSSVNANRGIVNVNQSSGHMNNQGITMALSVIQ
jgi:hypothetical protein